MAGDFSKIRLTDERYREIIDELVKENLGPHPCTKCGVSNFLIKSIDNPSAIDNNAPAIYEVMEFIPAQDREAGIRSGKKHIPKTYTCECLNCGAEFKFVEDSFI